MGLISEYTNEMLRELQSKTLLKNVVINDRGVCDEQDI